MTGGIPPPDAVMMRSLLDNAPAVIFTADRDGTINYINHPTPPLTHADVIGKSLFDFAMPDQLERIHGYVDQVLETGQPVSYEIDAAEEYGGAWYSVQVGALHRDGEVVGLSMILIDITSRRDAEQELAAALEEVERSNRELEQFAYAASHDLQEPLRMVSSYAQLLAAEYSDVLDDDGRTYIDFAVEGARRMRSLIDDLLDYSRVGRGDASWCVVDVQDTLRGVLSTLKVVIAESDASVTVDEMPKVRGVTVQIDRLFQNLVGNALKFRGTDAPVVHVRQRIDGKNVIVTVSDNGVGIPQEFRNRVFGAFKRLHSRAEYDGSGMGLTLAKKIIEQHGGKIWVEPSDKGTTIAVSFPRF